MGKWCGGGCGNKTKHCACAHNALKRVQAAAAAQAAADARAVIEAAEAAARAQAESGKAAAEAAARRAAVEKAAADAAAARALAAATAELARRDAAATAAAATAAAAAAEAAAARGALEAQRERDVRKSREHILVVRAARGLAPAHTHVATVGHTGVGKSTLVCRLLGVVAGARRAAVAGRALCVHALTPSCGAGTPGAPATGAVECTEDSTPYVHPRRRDLTIWDNPGARRPARRTVEQQQQQQQRQQQQWRLV
jgi:hypothetical protein